MPQFALGGHRSLSGLHAWTILLRHPQFLCSRGGRGNTMYETFEVFCALFRITCAGVCCDDQQPGAIGHYLLLLVICCFLLASIFCGLTWAKFQHCVSLGNSVEEIIFFM